MRVLVAVAAALLLAGCGSDGDADPPATSPSTTAETHSTADTAFLTSVRGAVDGGTDADLIRQGKDACDSMTGSGATQLDAASALVDAGFDTAAAAAIVTAAVKAYCPGAPAY